MSSTNREVVASLRQILAAKGMISVDSDWSTRLILFYLMKARSIILKTKIEEKSSRVSHANKQTITCLEVRDIDLAECPCTPRTGCTFKKSVLPIPNPITRYLEVTPILANKQIVYVEWGRFKDKINSRMFNEREGSYWTIKDTGSGPYIYIYNYTNKFIAITSIFEDPISVFLYPSCDGTIENKCAQYLDFPFMIDDAFLPLVTESAYRMLKEKVKVDDNLINQKDDTADSKTPIK